MKTRSVFRPGLIGLGLVVAIVFLVARAGRPVRTLQLSGNTMGTTYTVRIVTPSAADFDSAFIHDTVQTVLDRFERVASTYDDTSELSRFNRQTDTVPLAVSPPLAAVLRIAERVSERSGGAFDVTVGPLVEAWGFGSADPGRGLPDVSMIDSLRANVGYQRLSVDPTFDAIAKHHASIQADLSAVAKGYGVDLVAGTLVALGYERFLVEIGGEVVGRGRRGDGGPWKLGIERPDTTLRSFGLIIDVRDAAVATSGDYRNYRVIEGQRYSHIIDPRTGRPLAFLPSAVTVVHSSAAEADAWATALFVLGVEAGMAVAEREGLAVLFQRYDEGEIVLRRSSAFVLNVTEPGGQ